MLRAGARDGALMVWDVRCEAAVCQRNHTSYQAPVLVVQVRLPCNSYCPEMRELLKTCCLFAA